MNCQIYGILSFFLSLVITFSIQHLINNDFYSIIFIKINHFVYPDLYQKMQATSCCIRITKNMNNWSVKLLRYWNATSHRRRDQVVFVLEYCRRRRVGRGIQTPTNPSPPSSMKPYTPIANPVNLSYISQLGLSCHRYLVTICLISTSDLQNKHWSRMP